jgi:chemotaxis signal transduction protein
MRESAVRCVCFDLCGEAFAFDMEHLIEIVQIRSSEITPCFTPVPFVRGIWLYRTQAIPVIDVREFFHLSAPPRIDRPAEPHAGQPAPEKRDHSMLVVRIREQTFGIFSDAVLQVVPAVLMYAYPDCISTLPQRYFLGMIRIRHALALVLALNELVSDHELELLRGDRSP